MGKPDKKKEAFKGSDGASSKNEDRFDSNKPQFRKPKERSSKVVLDDRFASVLTDSRFQLDVKDKYGRAKKKKRDKKEELGAFYTIEKEGEGASVEEKRKPANSSDDDGDDNVSNSSSNDASLKVDKGKASAKKEDREEEPEDPASRIAYLTALSRGEIDASSSSSSSDEHDDDSDGASDSDDESQEDVVMGKSGVLDPSLQDDEQIEITTDKSPYLAILNMDWSHFRAVDIFTILSSFCPPGAVKRVCVYPSDFGKEKLAKEALFGPVDVWKKDKKEAKNGENDDDDEDAGSFLSEKDHDEDLEKNDDEKIEDDGESLQDDGDMDTAGATVPQTETGFDPEKLRAYEASKLKYYFAVVEFASSEHADIAYKEVDGMEFEHSSAAMDLRSIPVDGLEDVVKDRELRDEATSIPSNYDPPEFVINALQQTNVQCTWDEGDQERQTMLTKYSAGDVWGELAEGEILKTYVASDHSSDEESNGENEKASQMRKMLGLDSDDGDDDDQKGAGSSSESDAENDGKGEAKGGSMEVSFVPGKPALPSKPGLKLEPKDNIEEMSPWEKYQEKRKQKRREKRQSARAKRKEVNEIRKGGNRGKPVAEPEDDFFTDAGREMAADASALDRFSSKQTKGELELLVAGDDNEEEQKDFDMRGIARLDKNKDKKLRGARKRKEDKLASNVTGADFKVDLTDDRFKAVLDGADDRFGIDRTDPNFKETSAMRDILTEQTIRRKKKRKTKAPPAVDSQASKSPSGASALSALVSSIKSKVNKK